VITEWLSGAEQIVVPATINGVRVLGFVGAESGSGVTSLARTAAEALVKTGAHVLYADLASPLPDNVSPLRAGKAAQHWRGPTLDQTTGMNVTAPLGTYDTRFLFNNIAWLRDEFETTFRAYSNIIVDLPPLSNDRLDSINPLAAAACEATVLICVRGRTTRRQIENAIELLKSARVNLVGTVLNEADYTAAGEEMAKNARAWLPRFAGINEYVARKLAASEMLR
jgi:Mrp family chromosome partitioning ATPase